MMDLSASVDGQPTNSSSSLPYLSWAVCEVPLLSHFPRPLLLLLLPSISPFSLPPFFFLFVLSFLLPLLPPTFLSSLPHSILPYKREGGPPRDPSPSHREKGPSSTAPSSPVHHHSPLPPPKHVVRTDKTNLRRRKVFPSPPAQNLRLAILSPPSPANFTAKFFPTQRTSNPKSIEIQIPFAISGYIQRWKRSRTGSMAMSTLPIPWVCHTAAMYSSNQAMCSNSTFCCRE